MLAELLDRCEQDPTLVAAVPPAVAQSLREEGNMRLRWQIVELRAQVARATADDDRIRERYSELLDEHRSEPGALASLRPVGEEIRRLEEQGLLPNTLVARPPRQTRQPRARPPR